MQPPVRFERQVPPYSEEMGSVKRMLRENRSLGLVLIDASSLSRIERLHGRNVYRNVIQRVGRLMSGLQGDQIREEDILAVNREGGDQFLIFLNKKRDDKYYCTTGLESLSERIGTMINARVADEIFPYLKGKANMTVGHAIIIDNPMIEEANLIEKLLQDARTMASFYRFRNEIRNKEKLQEIIIKEELTTLFQPIVELASRNIIGYEALTRGPKDTEYENPYFLFDTAKEVGLIFELDRICRRRALLASTALDASAYVFVNCLPSTMQDPEFKGDYLKNLLADVQRRPQKIVIEVSEREAIDDYPAFRSALQDYSKLGFSIAVDDTGAGYSSLEAIVELQPDYLKLDMSMVRDIHEHPLKQELIRAIASFSKKIGATIIAEGIETTEELDVLSEIGVPLGQGYLFGRPRVYTADEQQDQSAEDGTAAVTDESVEVEPAD